MAFNNNNEGLYLTFSTAPAASSLTGLTGGTIESGVVLNLVGGIVPLYNGFSGSIAPATVSAPTPSVPEPASLALLALGLLAWLTIGFARKRAVMRKLQD